LISKILRFFLKLVLGIFAAVFAVSLLVAALIVMVLSVLKSLVTGRKPAPAVVFGRFQRYSPQGMWPGGPAKGNAANPRAGDVVDVEVREVRDK
jgi:hypothetical protein